MGELTRSIEPSRGEPSSEKSSPLFDSERVVKFVNDNDFFFKPPADLNTLLWLLLLSSSTDFKSSSISSPTLKLPLLWRMGLPLLSTLAVSAVSKGSRV